MSESAVPDERSLWRRLLALRQEDVAGARPALPPGAPAAEAVLL
jgi:hypothetical protein